MKSVGSLFIAARRGKGRVLRAIEAAIEAEADTGVAARLLAEHRAIKQLPLSSFSTHAPAALAAMANGAIARARAGR